MERKGKERCSLKEGKHVKLPDFSLFIDCQRRKTEVRGLKSDLRLQTSDL